MLEIREEVRGDRRDFVLVGELDMAGTDALEKAVLAGSTDGVTRVVFDLRELTFIDSTGLRALVGVHDLCRERGCEVALIPGRRAVQRVFDLTGLAAVLPFAPGASA
ncbi:MAG TPA: STAS domain-containing protein [Solirubrobacteraceae bacterium]|jgi:anti-anti-sigma factor